VVYIACTYATPKGVSIFMPVSNLENTTIGLVDLSSRSSFPLATWDWNIVPNPYGFVIHPEDSLLYMAAQLNEDPILYVLEPFTGEQKSQYLLFEPFTSLAVDTSTKQLFGVQDNNGTSTLSLVTRTSDGHIDIEPLISVPGMGNTAQFPSAYCSVHHRYFFIWFDDITEETFLVTVDTQNKTLVKMSMPWPTASMALDSVGNLMGVVINYNNEPGSVLVSVNITNGSVDPVLPLQDSTDFFLGSVAMYDRDNNIYYAQLFDRSLPHLFAIDLDTKKVVESPMSIFMLAVAPLH